MCANLKRLETHSLNQLVHAKIYMTLSNFKNIISGY